MPANAPGIPATTSGYRERLTPSLWIIVSAAVCAPMAALVFAPIDATLALAAGLVIGALIVVGLVAAAPRLAVTGTTLHVGRAHIDVALLGEPVARYGEDARRARGVDLPRSSWHLLRGGIDPVVVVPVIDPVDPVDAWVFSSRTPDRVVAAIARARRD